MMYRNQNQRLSAKAIYRSAAASLLAAIGLSACSPSTPEKTGADMQQDNVTASDLATDPSEYIGQTVTVRDEVEEVINNQAFLLDEDQLFGGKDILVLSTPGESMDTLQGDDMEVQVTGEVQKFILADAEQTLGVDLDDAIFADYEQQPVIMAASIAPAPDPEDISDNPERYYNQRIAIEGEIESNLGPDVVKIEDENLFGGNDLLVIHPQGEIGVQPDDYVTVTGVLRPFVLADINRDYDLTWDLDLQREIEAEYQSRPVLIADEFYPSATE